MTRASITEIVRLEQAGYKVERYGGGWMLRDPEGASLMIGDHGCIAPRQADAVAEGLERLSWG